MQVAGAAGTQVPELEENVYVVTGTLFITDKMYYINAPSASSNLQRGQYCKYR